MRPGDLDLCDLDTFADGFPHAYFAMLRREAPVCWHAEPDGPGFWAVTRHADLVHVSKHPRLFSSWLGGTNILDHDETEMATLRAMMLNMDPPEHVKHRTLVQRAFTSTSPATPIPTSLSGPASTTAWAPAWPACSSTRSSASC